MFKDYFYTMKMFLFLNLLGEGYKELIFRKL